MAHPFYSSRTGLCDSRFGGYSWTRDSSSLLELERMKPSYLLPEQSSLSRELTGLVANPFERSMYSTSGTLHSTGSAFKENPFLMAKPFRFCEKDPGEASQRGLSSWEKRKYLERYRQQNLDNEQDLSEEPFRFPEEEHRRGDEITSNPPRKTKNVIRAPTYVESLKDSREGGLKKGQSISLLDSELKTSEKRTDAVLHMKRLDSMRPKPVEVNDAQQESRVHQLESDPLNSLEFSDKGYSQVSLINRLISNKFPSKLEEPRFNQAREDSPEEAPYFPVYKEQEARNMQREEYRDSRSRSSFPPVKEPSKRRSGAWLNNIEEVSSSLILRGEVYSLVPLIEEITY